MHKIKNDFQLASSKKWLEEFYEVLDEAKNNSRHLAPKIRKAEIEGIQSQIQDLEAEINEYETIKATDPQNMKIESLEELPDALVRLRIARELTQAELAYRLGVKPQQIQKWEASCYERATYSSILKVARALGVEMEGSVEA